MPRSGPPRREEEELEMLLTGEGLLMIFLRALNRKMDKIMAEIDDLNAAVDKVSAAVTVAVSDIADISQKLTDALANANGDPALKAAVEAAAQKLNSIGDNLSAATPSDG